MYYSRAEYPVIRRPAVSPGIGRAGCEWGPHWMSRDRAATAMPSWHLQMMDTWMTDTTVPSSPLATGGVPGTLESHLYTHTHDSTVSLSE
jgi:hypothetical protein